MLTLAVVAAVVLFMVLAWQRHLLNRVVVASAMTAGIGALAGARIMGTLNTGRSIEALLAPNAGSFSIWGGVAGGLATALVFAAIHDRRARARGRPTFRSRAFFDLIAPVVGVGIAVARVGCWFAGCCFGEPTSLPWGIRYPAGSHAHVAYIGTQESVLSALDGPPAVHPIPLFEIAVALSGVVIALRVWRRFVEPGHWAPGASAAVFVAWYAGWRALLEPIRHQSLASLLPGWGWQIVFVAIAMTAFTWLISSGVHATGPPRAPVSAATREEPGATP